MNFINSKGLHYHQGWRRKWQPTPVFLPGGFHVQRSLEGYSPWGPKELSTTKRITHTIKVGCTVASHCMELRLMLWLQNQRGDLERNWSWVIILESLYPVTLSVMFLDSSVIQANKLLILLGSLTEWKFKFVIYNFIYYFPYDYKQTFFFFFFKDLSHSWELFMRGKIKWSVSVHCLSQWILDQNESHWHWQLKLLRRNIFSNDSFLGEIRTLLWVC